MLRLQRILGNHRRRTLAMMLAFVLVSAAIGLWPVIAVTYADDPPPNDPPAIEWFAISEGPFHTYEFFGYVSDADNSTEGYVVEFGGNVSGISATVAADGSFDESFYLPDIESGIVTADTADPQGASAETAAFDLLVTSP